MPPLSQRLVTAGLESNLGLAKREETMKICVSTSKRFAHSLFFIQVDKIKGKGSNYLAMRIGSRELFEFRIY
jgi:hypothetical protein